MTIALSLIVGCIVGYGVGVINGWCQRGRLAEAEASTLAHALSQALDDVLIARDATAMALKELADRPSWQAKAKQAHDLEVAEHLLAIHNIRFDTPPPQVIEELPEPDRIEP